MSTDRRTRGSISSQHTDANVHSTSVDGSRQLTRRSDEVIGSFDPMAETTQRIPYGYEDFTGGKINSTVTLNSSRKRPSNHGEFPDQYGIGRDSSMSRDSQRIAGRMGTPKKSNIPPQHVGMKKAEMISQPHPTELNQRRDSVGRSNSRARIRTENTSPAYIEERRGNHTYVNPQQRSGRFPRVT